MVILRAAIPGRPWLRNALLIRWQSTAASSARPEAYVSTSLSPLFNLSLEEHLLRTRPKDVPLILIYRNSPCIVIGRNQNPWKELNIASMRQLGIPLVRRRSGGGAVYHDLGNTNFSLHVARERFERRTGAEMISRALNGQGIRLRSLRGDEPVPSADSVREQGQGSPEGAFVNERHDLVVRVAVPNVNDRKGTANAEMSWAWQERKISGSAFKILTNRAYHHGTMLLSSDLSALGSSLRNTKSALMTSKGVESVKSPVVNLSQAFPQLAQTGQLSHQSFTKAVITEFCKTYDAEVGREESEESQAAINWTEIDASHAIAQEQKRMELEQELGGWDWVFGQCPEFETTISLDDFSGAEQLREIGLQHAQIWLRSKNGIILDVEAKALEAAGEEDQWLALLQMLRGERYDLFTDRPPLLSETQVARESIEGTEAHNAGVQALGGGEQAKAFALWLREAM